VTELGKNEHTLSNYSDCIIFTNFSAFAAERAEILVDRWDQQADRLLPFYLWSQKQMTIGRLDITIEDLHSFLVPGEHTR
jgi:hypothetical protein